jgi:pimeloyl-ACP methyl ester carboxylesterase
MKTVSLGDFDLAVEDRGAGRALLLVHGFPLDHTLWRHQLDYFSKRYRVIAPDLRGFGASGPAAPPDGSAITMRQYAEDLDLLLDRLDVREPVVFCGLSMGGYIGWQFWQKHAGRVAGLAACDTRTVADSAEAATGRETLSRRVLAEGVSVVAEAMLPRLFNDAMRAQHPHSVSETREMMASATPAGVAAALRGMAVRPNIIPRMLAEIAVPTLVMVGEHDMISPVEQMRGIAANIPAAEFQMVAHAGHMSPLENPGAFNTALDAFLTQRLGW